MFPKRSRAFKIAQTTSELAVFGSILIFILGIIMRQALGFSFTQNSNLKATRMAMKLSYEHSAGFTGGGGGDGDASRNSASILIIEDRLTASSAKYGSVDRSPMIINANATHSRNLFMPVESGELFQMPALDAYINGKYFEFKTAWLKSVNTAGMTLYKKVYNMPNEPYDPAGPDSYFDLNRNGTLDPEEPQPAIRPRFSWQWQPAGGLAEGDLVDVDDDLKTERVMKVTGTIVEVMDYQDGDIDFTQNTYDLEVENEPPFGLTNDAQVFTFTETPNDPAATGTFLRIEEGRLVDAANQVVRSVQRKDQIDLISRHIRLSNDLGRWCPGGVPTSPVEACGSCLTTNYDVTCFGTDAEGYPSIWVRSRIQDRRGRKWVTNIMADDYMDL